MDPRDVHKTRQIVDFLFVFFVRLYYVIPLHCVHLLEAGNLDSRINL